MRRFLLLCIILIIIGTFLPLSAQEADPIDTDADPVPIVSSGSFTCDTWIHTSMDSFSVGGGELTGANWSFGQGYISYNLTGTFTPGETLSLNIAGTMGEMGYQMQHVGNNLSFYAKYYDKSGQELIDLKRTKAFEKSTDATMTDEISAEALDYVKKIELHGSFTCKWRTPYSSASETVAVKVILESKSEPEPIPTTIEPSFNETPVKTQEPQIPPSSKPSWEAPEVPFPGNPDDPIWETFSRSKVKFADMHGEVNVKRYSEDDDAYIFAEMDTPLYHGCVIRTLPQSGAILSFGDMTSFAIKPDTIIILDLEYPEESKIKLVAGNTWTNLKQMIKDGSMEVEMAQACAGIKGTTLICEELDGISTLKVFEGTVELTSKETGKSVLVSGGHMISVDGGVLGKPTTFDMEAELASWDPYVQQVTATAMKEANRKNSGFSIIIRVVLVILLAGGIIMVVLMTMRNKRKNAGAPTYAAPVQTDRRQGPKFCPSCGAVLGENNKFCGKCGQRLP